MALAKDLAGIGIPDQQALMLGDTYADTLTATGNASQANALQLSASINCVTVSTATNNSVKLPAIAGCKSSYVMVRNDDATDALNVYPATGEYINDGGQNAGVVVASKAVSGDNARVFFKVSTTKWIST